MRSEQLHILILGGTGAMGNHLVNILSSQKHFLYVTTRSERKSDGFITYIKGNAHDLPFLKSILDTKYFDVIIDFMAYNTIEFTQRYSILLKGASQYIFLSSARVYAQSQGLITEESPRLLDVCNDKEYLETDEYALTKARQENVLYNSTSNNWTIIRPFITYSEARLQLGVFEKEDWLYRVLQGRSVVFSKDIASHFTTLTYGYDVAKGIAGLVGCQAALGETFHIATSESHSWEKIVNLYQEVIDDITGKKTSCVMVNHCFFLNNDTAKFAVKYSRLFDYHFDNSKILKFVPQLQFENTLVGLRHCLTTFLKQPSFQTISFYVQANLDRDAKELTPLNEMNGFNKKAHYLFYRYTPNFILKLRRNQLLYRNKK